MWIQFYTSKHFYCYVDLESVANDLKNKLQMKLLDRNFVKPFLGTSGEIELDKKTIEETYIDLAILSDGDVDERYIRSSRKYQLNIIQSPKRSVTLEDISSYKDQFVFISGVPGIGKTTLMKKFVLEWKDERLYNGQNGSTIVHLVFPFLCRELNQLILIDNESPEQIIQQMHYCATILSII